MRQAGLYHFKDNVHANRGAGGGSKEGGNRSLLVRDYLGPVVDDSRFAIGFFDGLNPDARVNQPPVGCLGARIENMKGRKAVGHALQPLLDQITNQIKVSNSDIDQGEKISRPDGKGKVRPPACLMKKFGGPRPKGAKKQSLFSIKDTGVQVGNGHGWSRPKGLTVYFGLMLFYNFGIVTYQPLSPDGKPANPFAFRDAGFLQ